MESVTPGLWDFAAAAAWERQAEEEQQEREDGTADDAGCGKLSPMVGLSPAELWRRSLDEPGATVRMRRQQEEAPLDKLTPLEQIKQRMLAHAAIREEQERDESLRLVTEACTDQAAVTTTLATLATTTLAATADDDKTAPNQELQQRVGDAGREERHESTPTRSGGAHKGVTARERFFASLSRPKGICQRPRAQRCSHTIPARQSSSSSSEEGDREAEPLPDPSCGEGESEVVDADAAPTRNQRRSARIRRHRTRRRVGSGAQSVIRDNLRRAAAAAALPTPEENEHAKEAKAQLMSQSDGNLHDSSAIITQKQDKPAGLADEFAGLAWGREIDDDDDNRTFGEQRVTLGASGGWSQSEVAVEWGTLSGTRQDGNSNGQIDPSSSQHANSTPRWQFSRPSTAGGSAGPSGLSEFGAILIHRSPSSAGNTRPAASGQRMVGKLGSRPHTSCGSRTRALSAPIVRQLYDDRLQAEQTCNNAEDQQIEEENQETYSAQTRQRRQPGGAVLNNGRPGPAGSLAERDTSDTDVHTRLASAPIRRESAATVARADDSLPLVKREQLPTKIFAHRSAGENNASSSDNSTMTGNLEQATRAQKFFRSHKQFALQPAGFRPGSKAAALATIGGPPFESSSSIPGHPSSSSAAAMTNRGLSVTPGVVGGSMKGSVLLTTSAAARANKNRPKWERYQRYASKGIDSKGGAGSSSGGGSRVGRAPQRHVAVPMAVPGVDKHQRPQNVKGTAGVAATACRVQRSRAVSPHVQGPNSIGAANGP